MTCKLWSTRPRSHWNARCFWSSPAGRRLMKCPYDTLENIDQTLEALMSALDARDRETEGHSARVSHLTAELGKKLNSSREQLKVLERGSLLHDIGKIGISDAILHKPEPLTEEEWVVMRRHPDIGARIIERDSISSRYAPAHSTPSGKMGRHRLPGRAAGRGYSHSCPHVCHCGCLRCADLQASLSKKDICSRSGRLFERATLGILFDPQIVEVFKSLIAEDPTGTVFVEKS